MLLLALAANGVVRSLTTITLVLTPALQDAASLAGDAGKCYMHGRSCEVPICGKETCFFLGGFVCKSNSVQQFGQRLVVRLLGGLCAYTHTCCSTDSAQEPTAVLV